MIAAYEMDGTGPVAADSGVNELHGVFSGTTADDSDVCSPQNTCEAACGAGSQIAFDMSSNAGPGCENCKMPADSMCTGYWNNGGCGGIDAGRCGVTPDGAQTHLQPSTHGSRVHCHWTLSGVAPLSTRDARYKAARPAGTDPAVNACPQAGCTRTTSTPSSGAATARGPPRTRAGTRCAAAAWARR